MLFEYTVTIHHISVSPGHNYFGHEPDAPGRHPTLDVAAVQARAGRGLEDDRYFGRGEAFDGQVTFVAWEVYRLLVEQLGLNAGAEALRRNIVMEGVPLNSLIGQEFAIDGVRFRGMKHCAPCRWMDAAAGRGARALMKGRGGLRAQVLSDGVIRRGAAVLTVGLELDPAKALERLPTPRLP